MTISVDPRLLAPAFEFSQDTVPLFAFGDQVVIADQRRILLIVSEQLGFGSGVWLFTPIGIGADGWNPGPFAASWKLTFAESGTLVGLPYFAGQSMTFPTQVQVMSVSYNPNFLEP